MAQPKQRILCICSRTNSKDWDNIQRPDFNFKLIKERKERVLIATEMAKLALEEYLVDLAFDSATLAVKDTWDPIKDHDLIIAQSESHNIIAKCYVEYLLEEEIEIGHK